MSATTVLKLFRTNRAIDHLNQAIQELVVDENTGEVRDAIAAAREKVDEHRRKLGRQLDAEDRELRRTLGGPTT